jgi:hypothetical protein
LPSGEATTNINDRILQQPEHINSEVMVDLSETFQACLTLCPRRARLEQKMIEGLTTQEELPGQPFRETIEQVPVRSGVITMQRNKLDSRDP